MTKKLKLLVYKEAKVWEFRTNPVATSIAVVLLILTFTFLILWARNQ